MAVDPKYGRVNLEHGTIGEDEVVIVFRATDKLLPMVLGHYYDLCRKARSPVRHLDLVLNAREEVDKWQADNLSEVRVPHSESSKEWLDGE